jgi:hypothetical protein
MTLQIISYAGWQQSLNEQHYGVHPLALELLSVGRLGYQKLAFKICLRPLMQPMVLSSLR